MQRETTQINLRTSAAVRNSIGNFTKPERREVEIGEFTDEFIEIKKGLKEGEVVLLRPPGGAETETGTGAKPAEAKPTTPAEKSPPPPQKAGKATASVQPCEFGGTSNC